MKQGDYRPEIDGLRALAVIPVMFFHAGFTAFSGGFVGVDVFFVISGYLITTIILREQTDGKFSIIRFYERRARRILPALFLVVLCCVPISIYLMTPWHLESFAKSIIAVVLFASNILFWQESGYFESAVELKPLLHTWSLAVEEQYYVFFPLVMLVLWRLGKKLSFALILAGIALSLGISEWASLNKPTANFYLLPTRAWELLIGSVTAIWLLLRQPYSGVIANVLAALGVVLIAYAVIMFDRTTSFPGLAALVPTLGTALLILCAERRTVVGQILASRGLVGIGLISYSAYLWHQPLFAFARLRSIEDPSLYLMSILILVSLMLAGLSWKYIERPFRNPEKYSRRHIFFSGFAVSILFVALSLFILKKDGFPDRVSERVWEIANYAWSYAPDSTQHCVNETKKPYKFCVFNPTLTKEFVIWGDSHANVLSMELARALHGQGKSLIKVTMNDCPPVPGINPTRKGKECAKQNANALNAILSDDEMNVIILSARWALTLEGTRYDNEEGAKEYGHDIDYVLTSDQDAKHLTQEEISLQIRIVIDSLLRANKKVVVVGNIPEAGWDVPNTLIKIERFGSSVSRPLSTSYRKFSIRNASSERVFTEYLQHESFYMIRPAEIFCDSILANRCVVEDGGVPLYTDDDHVTRRASKRITDLLIEKTNGMNAISKAFN